MFGNQQNNQNNNMPGSQQNNIMFGNQQNSQNNNMPGSQQNNMMFGNQQNGIMPGKQQNQQNNAMFGDPQANAFQANAIVNDVKKPKNDNLGMIQIVGGLIIFTALMIFAILQFTASDNSVSTGGAFVSGDAFKQSSEPEKKPKMRTASTQMNKRDSIDLFEKTNDAYFAEQRKAAEAEEAERKARLMGGNNKNSGVKVAGAENQEGEPAAKTAKKSSKKKAKQETLIPRMTLGTSRTNTSLSTQKNQQGQGGAGAAGAVQGMEGMPDLSNLPAGAGVDTDQLNKLMQQAGQQGGQ